MAIIVERKPRQSSVLGLDEVVFTTAHRQLDLYLTELEDITSAVIYLGSIGSGHKEEGETTALYYAAAQEMRKLASEKYPVFYIFSTDVTNERLVYFGKYILPNILGCDVEFRNTDDGKFNVVAWIN